MYWVKRLIQFLKSVLFKRKSAETGATVFEDVAVIMPILNNPGKYVFYCPGCEANHIINTDPKVNPFHTLTGTLAKPTIRASVMSNPSNVKNKVRCHSFVTDGKIEFLSDCTHHLTGQTIDLSPF